jgi:hypothetical protein
MSGIVNETDLSALAAEYVIGTLDPDERARANAQLAIDEGFRAMVRGWERRLGELHLMVEPVEPDGRIWDRISDRMGFRTPAPAPFVPPPFAPQPAATPFAATVSTPLSPPLPEPRSGSAAPVATAFEPTVESKLEAEPQAFRPLPSAATFPPPPPPSQQDLPRTPEQELASLIAEADRFTTQLSEMASAPPAPEKGRELPAEPLAEPESHDAALHADSLLAEAADAIAARPSVEPDHEERVAESWPDEAAATDDLPPPIRDTGPRRDSTMLMSPADVAQLMVRRQQHRIGRWRATALLMTFLALGLGSLMAAWRFAPDRLPHGLQPIAVLGLGDWSPSERLPAEHGTQFEE